MQHKKFYNKQVPLAAGQSSPLEPKSIDVPNLNISKETAIAGIWCLILAGWLGLSMHQDNYLLSDTMPAFFIVTFLCLIKALENQQKSNS